MQTGHENNNNKKEPLHLLYKLYELGTMCMYVNRVEDTESPARTRGHGEVSTM